MTIPYTYLIVFKPTGQKYYGCRYAINCNPNDLWKTYFTSSKEIKKLRETFGNDAFEFQIRQKFQTSEQAIKWEFKFLTRVNAARSPDWLNNHNGDGRINGGFLGKSHSLETKLKMSSSARGRKRPDLAEMNKLNPPNKGKKFTEEHKRKIGQSKRGKKRPDLSERNRLSAKKYQ